MSVFIVSYDLRAPGRNYEPLWARLRQFVHAKPLESVWLIDTQMSAVQLRNDLERFLDRNDRLIAAQLAGPSAWTDSLPQATKEFIWARFGKG